jgi:hypothetical protein
MTNGWDCGMDSADLGLGPLDNFSEHGNKHLGPI